ncbi:LacI family DNA-binding transcriptional regulator [Pelagicoccus mobilis]|uniref:LacI family DNA-binding transcriptional regulator n=1 Tax=Pelagicoccus mobilis TaxID=415221 RepID=A0A934VSR9_9BACT|nr:LacI family DNA-binding transcriptional regulator [Pelagicoccus mobilis]MBK1879305.1 LacI family DNA-binding transcriptional regulator [Pelagicoccus mobilis]
MATPTLKDVAKAAEVHVSTVSRALKRDPALPADTITRINSIAKQLGYRRNPLTTALMEARRRGSPARFQASIGLLAFSNKHTQNSERSWLARVYKGASEAAKESGFAIEIYNLIQDGTNRPEQLERVLDSRGVQGLILPPEHEAPLPFELPWDKYSYLSLHTGRATNTPRFNQIASNHHSSTTLACSQSYKRGYKKVGLVLRDHPSNQVDYGRLVLGAFYARSSLEPEENQIPPLKITELEVDTIAKWVKKHGPDVIIFAGGGFSLTFDQKELIKRLATKGVSIGSEIGMVVLCQLPGEGIAGIDERPEEIGKHALQLLGDQVCRNERGIPSDPLTHFVDGIWVEGDTLPKR